jgi:hypothetical protein
MTLQRLEHGLAFFELLQESEDTPRSPFKSIEEQRVEPTAG